jgi:hypothetical protein
VGKFIRLQTNMVAHSLDNKARHRPRLDEFIFQLMQTAYAIFMYYYKFVKVVYDKIA